MAERDPGTHVPTAPTAARSPPAVVQVPPGDASLATAITAAASTTATLAINPLTAASLTAAALATATVTSTSLAASALTASQVA